MIVYIVNERGMARMACRTRREAVAEARRRYVHWDVYRVDVPVSKASIITMLVKGCHTLNTRLVASSDTDPYRLRMGV